jgi:L-fucose dehydrogenase
MDLGLKDHLILITGGASGIGQAITRACLAEGARVVVLSRISAGVEDFMAETKTANLPCELITVELDQVDQCIQAVADVAHRYGRINALINNAAINDGVGLENGDPARFQASLNLNLLPSYVLAQAALTRLKESRGTILNIGSKVALTGQGNTSGYAAAKGGLLALTREWAVELLPYGIRVNAVIPAEVMTPAYRTWLSTLVDPDVTLSHITAQIPLEHRMTRPEEIASAVVFLLSPSQSGHTTGQQILVDGGYVHLDRMVTTKRPLH